MNTEWYEPRRKQEHGVWVLYDDQVERNRNPIFDLTTDFWANGISAWVVNTKHGAVLIGTWSRTSSPNYIEYHIWIDGYRYWQRKYDVYQSDQERVQSAHDFAQLVMDEIERVQKS